jgi:hypothetical protein
MHIYCLVKTKRVSCLSQLLKKRLLVQFMHDSKGKYDETSSIMNKYFNNRSFSFVTTRYCLCVSDKNANCSVTS